MELTEKSDTGAIVGKLFRGSSLIWGVGWSERHRPFPPCTLLKKCARRERGNRRRTILGDENNMTQNVLTPPASPPHFPSWLLVNDIWAGYPRCCRCWAPNRQTGCHSTLRWKRIRKTWPVLFRKIWNVIFCGQQQQWGHARGTARNKGRRKGSGSGRRLGFYGSSSSQTVPVSRRARVRYVPCGEVRRPTPIKNHY
jgi:hypothetical protein